MLSQKKEEATIYPVRPSTSKLDPENGWSPNAPIGILLVQGDIGECPKPKKGACLLIKVVPYSLILVKNWSQKSVFELIFHTWLLVNQN